MWLLCLGDKALAELREALPAGSYIADLVEAQVTHALVNGTAEGRTVLLRDNGGGVPFLMVSYDDAREADRVWASLTTHEETIEWPEPTP